MIVRAQRLECGQEMGKHFSLALEQSEVTDALMNVVQIRVRIYVGTVGFRRIRKVATKN